MKIVIVREWLTDTPKARQDRVLPVEYSPRQTGEVQPTARRKLPNGHCVDCVGLFRASFRTFHIRKRGTIHDASGVLHNVVQVALLCNIETGRL